MNRKLKQLLCMMLYENCYISAYLILLFLQSKYLKFGSKETNFGTTVVKFYILIKPSNLSKGFYVFLFVESLNDTTNFLRADIDQHENAQLKISAAVSSLELFRLNQTLSKCGMYEIVYGLCNHLNERLRKKPCNIDKVVQKQGFI